jgi:hypothetical protein
MKHEVSVSKVLAETLKKKKSEREMRDTLRRFIILERASRPIKKNGKLIITEQASKSRILLEIFGSAISTYTQIWKETVDELKDWPGVVETVYNQLSKKEYQDIEDEEAIIALEEYIIKLQGFLDKAKKLRAEIGKRDEEIKKYADSITPGYDIATPNEININQIESPTDIAPENMGSNDSKARINVEDL